MSCLPTTWRAYSYSGLVDVTSPRVCLAMQETDCAERDWAMRRHQLVTIAAAQRTSEFDNWRHLMTSFGRPQVLDVNYFRWRHLAPHTTSYVDPVRRDWVVGRQLGCCSAAGDHTTDRSVTTTTSKETVPFSDVEEHRQSTVPIYRDLKDQHLANGT